MPESPHKTILDRDGPPKAMTAGYKPQLDLLTDMVNYTSNLIPRAYVSSEKQLRDVIVCFTLLKQFGVMLDAVQILARAGAITAAYIPARAAFEASLYIEWILVSDGPKKAAHYYVGSIRGERLWGKRVAKGSPESGVFIEEMRQLGVDLYSDRDQLHAEAQKLIDAANAVLAQSALAEANETFDAWVAARTKRGKNPPHEPEWYKVLGKRSIRSIAKDLGRLPEYIIHYSKGSQVMHSSSTKDHVAFHKAGAIGHPIRNLAGVHNLFNFVLSTGMVTFMRVLGFYRPGELPRWGSKYFEEWRMAFMNIPRIKIESTVPKQP